MNDIKTLLVAIIFLLLLIFVNTLLSYNKGFKNGTNETMMKVANQTCDDIISFFKYRMEVNEIKELFDLNMSNDEIIEAIKEILKDEY